MNPAEVSHQVPRNPARARTLLYVEPEANLKLVEQLIARRPPCAC